jgi:hypothetical protein
LVSVPFSVIWILSLGTGPRSFSFTNFGSFDCIKFVKLLLVVLIITACPIQIKIGEEEGVECETGQGRSRVENVTVVRMTHYTVVMRQE